MKNNNGKAIRKLSDRSLKNNRMRNGFAVLAIILTGMLFTAVFSLMSGAMQVAEESTAREVGGRYHAGLKAVTMEQYEKIKSDPMVKGSGYTIFIGLAENILKRQAELRYIPSEEELKDLFIVLAEGHLPEKKNEIVVDTFVLDELKLPHELGAEVPVTFTFMGEKVEEVFTVSGWYQGDGISHASELFLSLDYWNGLKGNLMEEDFRKWGEEHPEDSSVGLIAGNLYFGNTRDLEGKVQTVIRNAGYEPGSEVRYGVNWAYMSSRFSSVDPISFLILAGAVAVILLTGYLIIYNIFQISVMAEIRFYGLLKTIGTTGKQIRTLIRRQAVLLSAAGIPVGMALGYGIGKAALPFALSYMDYGNIQISLAFNPWILVFGGGFSILTVFFSCRKPGKIACSVSPVEAVKYTEAAGKGKKGKIRRKKFSIFSMALANLGRSKKKTVVVVAAVSLSMILLTIVTTAVGSFRLDSFIEQRIAGDFLLANVNVTSTPRSSDTEIDEEFLAMADGLEGVRSRDEMWVSYGKYIQADEQAREQYRKLDEEGKMNREQYASEELDQIIAGEKSMEGYFYGYSPELLENLEVMEGTLDTEKFETGDYILLGTLLGKEHLPSSDHVYHPGDRVTVESITENSRFHEVKNDAGETVDVYYDNLEEKEYQVMAIVEIPYSMNLHRYSANTCDAVLPIKALASGEGSCKRFAVSYQVEEEQQAAFEAVVKEYCENVNAQMGYLTKASLQKEFNGMVQVISILGTALAAVIALIGVLNFINAVITGIISRKREFAMLQSIGMSSSQLRKLLALEGISYVGMAGVLGFVIGSLLAWRILTALNDLIMFFEYRFQILPFLVMLPMLLLVAVAAPLLAYEQMRKKSIVERLRETE